MIPLAIDSNLLGIEFHSQPVPPAEIDGTQSSFRRAGADLAVAEPRGEFLWSLLVAVLLPVREPSRGRVHSHSRSIFNRLLCRGASCGSNGQRAKRLRKLRSAAARFKPRG